MGYDLFETGGPSIGLVWRAVTGGDYYIVIGDGNTEGASALTVTEGEATEPKATPAPTEPPTPTAGSFVSVSAGVQHTCGVRSDGSVVCWGNYDTGRATPPAGSFDSVSAGLFHTCGVKSDGSVACWGDDESGQATPPAGSFDSVSAGDYHTCGVKSDGSVACWGDDESGRATPPAGSFVSVSAGDYHTCGVRSDGSVACWGNEATAPAGSFDSVSAGSFHTCGVRSDGSVACWGFHFYGETTPPAGSFVSVSAGGYHTCGVRGDGSVACWGWDEYDQATPPAGSFVSVSAGSGHTCGVRSDGSVACWGDDESGQATPPTAPTAAPTEAPLVYEAFCSDLVPFDIYSIFFEIEDPTYGQLSEAMSESIDPWEAVNPPQEVTAWYDATLTAMQSLKTVLDAQPKGDAVDGEDETVGAALVAFVGGSSQAVGLLSRDVRNGLAAAGCLGADATPDNHGNDLSTATTIAVGDAIEGELNYQGDIDYFQFHAEAGRSYEVDLPFVSFYSFGSGHTKTGTLITVYDFAGQELAGTDDPFTELVWQAGATGNHYVVLGDGASQGNYTLTVKGSSDGGSPDDHGNDIDSATAISVGEGVQGSLDSQDDKDVFVFHAEAGRSYEVDLPVFSFYSFGSGHTKTGTLITVYDFAGQELAGTDDLLTELVWQAGATGNHYVVLGDGASQGNYTLTVKGSSDGGSPDDH